MDFIQEVYFYFHSVLFIDLMRELLMKLILVNNSFAEITGLFPSSRKLDWYTCGSKYLNLHYGMVYPRTEFR